MRTYERAGKYVPRKNTYVLARRDLNARLEDDPLQTFNSFKYHLVCQYYDSLKFTVIWPFLVVVVKGDSIWYCHKKVGLDIKVYILGMY